ncbi:hypothetical protein BG011_006367 [Mortierella polycephala]|uniref:SH3 domain-containing protein n=1 Tax=Mortierella polycephala TaxID=41804 RepID=A0A9P6QDF6_9FUNG|nr:hypothetical protein BG011_006367 [Mortierella polycephala]
MTSSTQRYTRHNVVREKHRFVTLSRLFAIYVSSTSILFSLLLLRGAEAAVTTTGTTGSHQASFLHSIIPPPVDFGLLGQMAVLGDFDALTPIVAQGQQNTFESNTFSILELVKIPTATEGPQNQDKVLSVPVHLASFGLDPPASTSASETAPSSYGISATCVLENAPHQIYIGGHFKQIPSAATADERNGTSTGYSVRTSLNYIGLYDSKMKRFLAMENGLDGPVHGLLCDSSTDQVYVVGQFRAPLQDDSMPRDRNSNINNGSRYSSLGTFGGGVAVWKRVVEADVQPTGESNASGQWTPVPFKGVNGVVTSVAKGEDGTFYFGGQFDTTTDGEAFSAPDTQLVDMNAAEITAGNGLDSTQDRNIICGSSSPISGNWMMRDNIPGYWRARFHLLVTPTLFRLWNVDTAQGPEFANRGTKTFSILAQSSNQALNLSYVDPATHAIRYCTECPLLTRSHSPSVQQEYQDFVVVKPVLLRGIQINIESWYGLGGGLGGIEVYQSEIYVHAADELNSRSKCKSTAPSSDPQDSNDMIAYSSSMGADWISTKMTKGWQTVLTAEISAIDETVRNQAYVDLSPYLPEAGMYDVYFYTPACSSGSGSSKKPANTSGSSNKPANTSLPSNACSERGSVDVSMYFGSPENIITVTLTQTNSVDKYEKIYSGMIVRSIPDFRPHVVVKPSVAKKGASGGGSTQTVVVDSIQFVKQASLDQTNSLIFYQPGSKTGIHRAGEGAMPVASAGSVEKNRVKGLDSSVWGNLQTQLPSSAVVNALIAYPSSMGQSSSASSLLFIGGNFQGKGFSNVVAWDGAAFVPLGGGRSASGLNGALADMALYQSTLYMVGAFQQSYGDGVGAQQLPGGLAAYNIQTATWTSFGNVTQSFHPGAQFRSIQLSAGPNGQPQLVQQPQQQESVAIWDINTQEWMQENTASMGDNDGFQFGYMRGQISYLNRVLGSSSDGSSGVGTSIVLVAGKVDSLDTYQLRQSKSTAWLTSTGKLRTVNLSPTLEIIHPGENGAANAETTMPVAQPIELSKTNAGIMYFNKGLQTWATIVGGNHADGSIGARCYDDSNTDSQTAYRVLNLGAISSTQIRGEILALGLNKDESNGYSMVEPGDELLLIGGSFKSGAPGVNALALYDLIADQAVPAAAMPAMRGINGRDPAVHVIKNRPGNSKSSIIVAGDFSGVGNGVTCELICLWDPKKARQALDKDKPLETSFTSLYGDSNSKNHLGVLKGIINDIAFEDDKNMFVAGDLVVNGVPCGVASFNFDREKWTTFGTMMNTAFAAGATGTPPGVDTLTGPVTAIAHDTNFHQFFVAGRSSTDGSAYFKKWNRHRFIRVSSELMPTSEVYGIEILPASENAPLRTADRNPSSSSSSPSTDDPSDPDNSNDNTFESDTTDIVEQGFILLVSGRIVLGTPFDSAMSLNNDRQEASLAFFDGKSWFPYLQSSRNGTATSSSSLSEHSPVIGSVTPAMSTSQQGTVMGSQKRSTSNLNFVERADPVATTSVMLTALPARARDQGVFRALAIAHLPRVISREYLALRYIILIAVGISLGLIFLIVLFGFLYVWFKKRLSKEKRASRPRMGSSFTEYGHDGYLRRMGGSDGGLYPADFAHQGEKKSDSFLFRRSKSNTREPDNTSALMSSLGITSALEAPSRLNRNQTHPMKDDHQGQKLTGAMGGTTRSRRSQRDDSGMSSQANVHPRPLVYRPNSTIEEATGALVTEFVRSHQQQLQHHQQSHEDTSQSHHDPQAPPSPDRRSKKSRNSIPYQQYRDSSSSDLMNPIAQGRFATLMAATDAPNPGQNPTTPQSNTPISPITTMTTPSGVIRNSGNSNFGSRGGSANTSSLVNGGALYYAKFPFRAREIGELGFDVGERILVVDMSDDIWWMGVLQDANGQQMHGVFPSNYVSLTP